MRFGILGPLEVWDGGRLLPLGAKQQRALLALLLLRRNEAISRDGLIHELWGDEPPKTAAKALQGHVSTLRRLLEPSRASGSEGHVLVTRGDGYELRIDEEQLDLGQFESLRRTAKSEMKLGRPEQASAHLREALALWRGQPLGELAYEPFADAEIARLEELRIAALEERIEADLACGQHAELVGELEALTRMHPLRERLRGQLMLCLYRAGRQADALAIYQDGRAALVEELGIEPGPALRELHQAILRQDPKLGLAGVTTRDSSGSFVGRELELGALMSGLDAAFAGRGRLFVLVGEPGIGKSRLADELLAIARDRGARVLVGRAWEAGGAPPYWPWIQALRTMVTALDEQTLQAQLGDRAPDLAHLLPELREILPGLDQAVPEGEAARFRLFDAVGSFLVAASEERPIALALDDMHMADESSLLLLRYVARQVAGGRVLLLCGFRSVDPTFSDAVSLTLAEVGREPSTARLDLDALDELDVAEYITSTTEAPPPEWLPRAVHAKAGGNPLFMTEIVRLLEAEGRFDASDERLGIPPGVRDVIEHRVQRLSEPGRSLLLPASVIGREFPLDLLARVTGVAAAELVEALDEAVAERLLGEVPGTVARLRFSHALIGDTLYDELSPAKRMRLHLQVGESIEAIHAVDLEAHLSELARHFVHAAPLGVDRKAVGYARRAGDRALEQLAFEEAARLYAVALELAEEPAERCELLLARGEAEARAGRTETSKQTLLETVDLAERALLPNQLALAALAYGGRLSWETSKGDEEWAPLLKRALSALPERDDPLRVALLARLAGLREAGFVQGEKVALARESVEVARRLGDPAVLARALAGFIPACETPDNVHELLALSVELAELTHEIGDKERALEAHEHCLGRYLELGDAPAARRELEAMRPLARELRQPAQEWLVAAAEARQALLEGNLYEAEGLIDRALRLGELAHTEIATNTYRQQLFLLRREQGRLTEVEELVRRSVVDYPENLAWRCVLTQTTAALGLEDESRRSLKELARDRFAAAPFQETWLTSMCLLAEAASMLQDAETVEVLYELLLPYGDRVAVSYPEIATGSIARYLGLLAGSAGRTDDAERHFATALRVNEQVSAKSWLALTQGDFGRFLLERGRDGDSELGRKLLEEARLAYRELGMRDTHARDSAIA